MHETLFETVYAPLIVRFGRQITARLPADLLARLNSGTPQEREDSLAIAQECTYQQRFFVQLRHQEQVIAQVGCTPQQYDDRTVPPAVVESALHYHATVDLSC